MLHRQEYFSRFVLDMAITDDWEQNREDCAFAGSRTRVYCLEGNYPNRWTTNAWTFFACYTIIVYN